MQWKLTNTDMHELHQLLSLCCLPLSVTRELAPAAFTVLSSLHVTCLPNITTYSWYSDLLSFKGAFNHV